MPRSVRDVVERGAPGEHGAAAELGVVRVLEVAHRRDAVDLGGDGAVLGAEDGGELVGGPDEELALDALGVGVLRAVEAAVGVQHLALEVGECLAHDALEERDHPSRCPRVPG